jgi:hypothetical protein
VTLYNRTIGLRVSVSTTMEFNREALNFLIRRLIPALMSCHNLEIRHYAPIGRYELTQVPVACALTESDGVTLTVPMKNMRLKII